MTDSAYFVQSTPLRAYIGSFCVHVTGKLKMCMKKFDAENIFFDAGQGFLT